LSKEKLSLPKYGLFVKEKPKNIRVATFFLGCFIWNHRGVRSVVAKLALTSSYNYNTGKEEICNF
jgi:hypothetical protein